MAVYTHFSLSILGGQDKVAEMLSSSSTPSKCPLGTPPLCCLLPCPKPNLSPTLLSIILTPLRLLTVALALNFLVNLFLVFSGFYPVNRADDFGNLLNLHNILLIPFFVSTMYTYKVILQLIQNKAYQSYLSEGDGLPFASFDGRNFSQDARHAQLSDVCRVRLKTFKSQLGTTLPGYQNHLLLEASGSGALASGPCGKPIVFVHPILQQHLGVRQLLEWSVYSKAKATSAVYQVLYVPPVEN